MKQLEINELALVSGGYTNSDREKALVRISSTINLLATGIGGAMGAYAGSKTTLGAEKGAMLGACVFGSLTNALWM